MFASSRSKSTRPSEWKGVLRARLRPGKGKSVMALEAFRAGEIEPDRLELGVLIVRVDGVVPSADARLPDPAEGRGEIPFAEGVHGNGPRSQRTCRAHCALAVAAEDRGGQP